MKKLLMLLTGLLLMQAGYAQIASPSKFGVLRIGPGLVIDPATGIVSTTLAPATSTTLGAVKAGIGLAVTTDGTLSVTATGGTTTMDASSLTTGALPDARLSNTGTAGTYGGGTSFINSITTDAKGRVTAVTTAVPTSTSGGSGTVVVSRVFIMSSSQSVIQAAINSLSATGGYLELGANFVDVGTTPLTVGASNNVTIDGLGKFELRSSTGSLLMLVSSPNSASVAITNLRITGMRFNSTYNSTGYAMLLSNETAGLTHYKVDNCYFTCPNGQFNAISTTQYSSGNSTGNTYSSDIEIDHNVGENIGRMFYEGLSQEYATGIYRLQGIRFTNNVCRNLGMNNQYGMMVSISAIARDIYIAGNRCTDANKICIEVVNAINVKIIGNECWWINNVFAGISLSDDSHSTTSDITITGNTIRSRDNMLQLFGVQRWTATGNIMICTSSSDQSGFTSGRVYIVQNYNGAGWTTTKGTFTGNTVITQCRKAVEIDNAPFNRVENNILSTEYYTGASEVVTVRNSLATGNVVQSNTYVKNGANTNLFNTNETGTASGNFIFDAPTLLNPQIITTGTATTLPQSTGSVIVNPASTLASHTITLPAAPYNSQVVQINFGGTLTSGTVVTTLSVTSSQGIVQNTTPTTSVAGDQLSYIYYSSTGRWHRK